MLTVQKLQSQADKIENEWSRLLKTQELQVKMLRTAPFINMVIFLVNAHHEKETVTAPLIMCMKRDEHQPSDLMMFLESNHCHSAVLTCTIGSMPG
eukprot:scaffold2944_cov155-Skeletonema_dohrnii-CCMP3373.AAC.43